MRPPPRPTDLSTEDYHFTARPNRTGYYAWAGRKASARTQADAALTAQIAAAHARSRRTYGAPRVHAELRAAGVRCARKRVARLLRAAGLVGCHRRRRTRTTAAEPTHPRAEPGRARLPGAGTRPALVRRTDPDGF